MVSCSFIAFKLIPWSNFSADTSNLPPNFLFMSAMSLYFIDFQKPKNFHSFSFFLILSLRSPSGLDVWDHPATAWNFWILRNLHSSLRDAATAEKLEINSPNWRPTMNGGKGWMTSDRFLVGDIILYELRKILNMYILNFERTHMKIVTPSFSERQPHGIW